MTTQLRTATVALLATAGAALAEADVTVDAGFLSYSEAGRISVVEPMLSVKKSLANERSLSVKVVLDAITGASPTGAMPSNLPQTITTASGRLVTIAAGDMPTKMFEDERASFDVGYTHPLHRLVTSELGLHYSTETDYISRGATATFNIDAPDRLTTYTVGFGVNSDRITPTGGKPVGMLAQYEQPRHGNGSKQVIDGMVGVTRVLSPVWLVQLNFGQTREHGYLTDPYKVVTVIDAVGNNLYERNEKRPGTRTRNSVFFSSTYQFTDDVVYSTYRYYRDDWGIQSSTIDLKYRYELNSEKYLQPHFRYYHQTAADFYRYGIVDGTPVPEYATSDYRFGKMTSTTIGLKYGFPMLYGEVNVKCAFMSQTGDQHPSQAVGVQKDLKLFTPVDCFIFQVGYSVDF